MSPPRAHNIVNFGPLAGEIHWRVWGTPVNFNGFRAKTLSIVYISMVSRLGSVTARHSSSGRQSNYGVEQRPLSIFGRAAITLGIGPHSSLGLLSAYYVSTLSGHCWWALAGSVVDALDEFVSNRDFAARGHGKVGVG